MEGLLESPRLPTAESRFRSPSRLSEDRGVASGTSRTHQVCIHGESSLWCPTDSSDSTTQSLVSGIWRAASRCPLCRPCPEGRSSRTPCEPAGMALRVTSACCPTAAAGGAPPPPTRAVSEHQLSFQQRRRLVASSLSFSELLAGRGLRVAAAAARRADPGRHTPLCGIWRAARKTGLPPCNLVPADSYQVTNSSLKNESFGV